MDRRAREMWAAYQAAATEVRAAQERLSTATAAADEAARRLWGEVYSTRTRAESALRLTDATQAALTTAFDAMYELCQSAERPVYLSDALVALVPALPEACRPEVTVAALALFLRNAGVVLAGEEGPAHNMRPRGIAPPPPGARAKFDDVMERFRASKRRR